MQLRDFPAAVRDFEQSVRGDAKMDGYRGELFLVQCYAAIGRDEDASAWFAVERQRRGPFVCVSAHNSKQTLALYDKLRAAQGQTLDFNAEATAC